jgi:hypothetical protein
VLQDGLMGLQDFKPLGVIPCRFDSPPGTYSLPDDLQQA